MATMYHATKKCDEALTVTADEIRMRAQCARDATDPYELIQEQQDVEQEILLAADRGEFEVMATVKHRSTLELLRQRGFGWAVIDDGVQRSVTPHLYMISW